MEHHEVHPSPNGSGHEHREVSVPFIVVSLALLLVGTFIVCIIVVGIFSYFNHVYQPQESARQSQQQIPPEPRVEVQPWQQLQSVKAREDHVLTSYAWVDQKNGLVRIPIAQAMDELTKQGLPSHDYLQDTLAGRTPPMPKPQGNTNVPK